MIVKRTRAAAGLATAFALIAVTAPGGPAALVSSSEPVDTVVPPTADSADSGFSTGGIDYEPSERVSVEVPAVAGRDLAAASRTVVSRMQDLEAGDIADRALGSYVFAAQAMQKADPDCQVTWSLLAAIGRIESAHGTKDGARLRNSGKADPAIRGAVLNGRGALPKVKDTDEGRLDEDRRWDRAVGPMQLLPSTWSYVGVDGDGNGKRTPDDLDDAALAVGVYLCAAADKAGDTGRKADDASRADRQAAADEGMQTALRWFNPSPAYSVLATRLEAEYLESYGVTPYSAAPGATNLQAISLIAPMAPTLSPDRVELAARAATVVSKDDRDDAGPSTDGPAKADPASPADPATPDGPAAPADSATPGTPDSPAVPATPPTPATPATPGTTPTTPTTTPTTPTTTPAEPTTVEPAPEPAPEPEPEPEPTPTPTVITVSGTLTLADGVYYLDGVQLDLTDYTGPDLADSVGTVVTLSAVKDTTPIQAR